MRQYSFTIKKRGLAGYYVTVTPSFRAFDSDNTLKFIQLAQRKWEKIIEFIENTGIVPHGGGSATCALCVAYGIRKGCYQCPIAKHTGQIYCKDTPYDSWCRGTNPASKLAAARAELTFLKKLEREISGENT